MEFLLGAVRSSVSVSVSEWLLQEEEWVGEALEAVLCAPESARPWETGQKKKFSYKIYM